MKVQTLSLSWPTNRLEPAALTLRLTTSSGGTSCRHDHTGQMDRSSGLKRSTTIPNSHRSTERQMDSLNSSASPHVAPLTQRLQPETQQS